MGYLMSFTSFYVLKTTPNQKYTEVIYMQIYMNIFL